MNHNTAAPFALNRALLLKWALGTVIFALLAGWSGYRDNPEGLLTITANSPCPPMNHSFTGLFWAVLGVAGGLGLALAVTAFIASELRMLGDNKTTLRNVAANCVAYAVAMAVLALLAFPIEAAVPLKPKPGCENVQR
jgi:hypothetical protein